jgi:serine protease Do
MKRLFLFSFLGFLLFTNTVRASDLSRLYEKLSPSVVVINTTQHEYSNDEQEEIVQIASQGSGVVISKEGLIMTAAHVVQVADVVNVKLLSGEVHSATVLGSIDMADVALIKLDFIPKNLVVAELGDSDKVKIGEDVFVIGAPYGYEHTLTAGYISSRRKPENFSAQLVPIEFLQTDAAINQGNSGGPLFNMDGEVMGIVSSILTQSGGFEGIGFAASINVAKELLLNQTPFWSGMELYFLEDELAKALNTPQDAGFLVQKVAINSVGQKLGLRAGKISLTVGENNIVIGGDIILEVQGMPISKQVEQLREIRQAVSVLKPGDSYRLKILRNGKVIDLARTK